MINCAGIDAPLTNYFHPLQTCSRECVAINKELSDASREGNLSKVKVCCTAGGSLCWMLSRKPLLMRSVPEVLLIEIISSFLS